VLNVGVVGLRYWGSNFLRVLVDMEATRVSRICDLNATRMAQFARRYPRSRAHRPLTRPDGGRLPRRDRPGEARLHALRPGVAKPGRDGKHTFVQNPLAPSSEQVQALLDAAATSNVVLMTGQTFLYSPPLKQGARVPLSSLVTRS
jgi:predicted dehydrogenase